MFLTAKQSDRTFINFMGATATPQGFLLPVLGILLVTSEWNQRTALVTFTLMPVRGRVMVAKVAAALLAGLAAIVLAVGMAALATVVGGADDAWANIGLDDFAKFGLLQVIGVLQGLAFGLLFLNSAAAIVTYFVLPIAFSIVANLWSALKDAAPWIDLGTSQQPLFGATNMTGEQWAQLATEHGDLGGAAVRARRGPGPARRGEVATPRRTAPLGPNAGVGESAGSAGGGMGHRERMTTARLVFPHQLFVEHLDAAPAR